jgi:hypothetical protein
MGGDRRAMTEGKAKKRSKRKLVLLVIWTALIVAAVLWLRCGNGWGIGGGSGSGSGSGTSTSTSTSTSTKKCEVRVSAKGIELDGKTSTRDEVVAKCKQGADVVVTGDAREGEWTALHEALDAAHVPSFVK